MPLLRRGLQMPLISEIVQKLLLVLMGKEGVHFALQKENTPGICWIPPHPQAGCDLSFH